MKDVAYCKVESVGAVNRKWQESHARTFMESVHVELPNEGRYIGVLEVLTLAASARTL